MLFISPGKLFSFSRYLLFYLEVLVKYENGLVKKLRLISNFMTSQPGERTILIHILSNISRSKSNQTVKFSQLIEFNTRSTFLEKSFTKWGGETSPRFFSKKLKLSISLDQQSKVLHRWSLDKNMTNITLKKDQQNRIQQKS